MHSNRTLPPGHRVEGALSVGPTDQGPVPTDDNHQAIGSPDAGDSHPNQGISPPGSPPQGTPFGGKSFNSNSTSGVNSALEDESSKTIFQMFNLLLRWNSDCQQAGYNLPPAMKELFANLASGNSPIEPNVFHTPVNQLGNQHPDNLTGVDLNRTRDHSIQGAKLSSSTPRHRDFTMNFTSDGVNHASFNQRARILPYAQRSDSHAAGPTGNDYIHTGINKSIRYSPITSRTREQTPAWQSVHNYVPTSVSAEVEDRNRNHQDDKSPGEDYIKAIDDLEFIPPSYFDELKEADVKPHPIKNTFDGGSNVEAFERMCMDLMLFFETSRIRSNPMRIKYMAQSFTGRALQEYAALIGHVPPPSPGEILRQIRTLLPDNISHSARRQLMTLSQGGHTVRTFEDRLRRIARRTRYCSMVELAHYFFDGLNPQIAARLSGRGIDPDFTPYDDILMESINIEREINIFNSRMKLQSNRGGIKPLVKATPATNNRSVKPPHKTVAANPPTKSNIVCFNCKQIGHTVTQCSQPKSDPRRFGVNQLKTLRDHVGANIDDGEESSDLLGEDYQVTPDSLQSDSHINEEESEVTPTESFDTATEGDSAFVAAMNLNALSFDSDSTTEDTTIDLGSYAIYCEKPKPSVNKAKAVKPRIEKESVSRPVSIKNCVPFTPGKSSWDKYKYVRISATINGHSVVCMVDSGSNADLISSTVVSLYNLPTKKLDDQLVIKLACQGSRTKCNEYCELPIVIDNRQYVQRMLVLNISENVILGTPFMYDNHAAVSLNPPGLNITKLGKPIEIQQLEVKHINGSIDFPIDLRLSKREFWENYFKPLTSGIPDGLPKLRTVNHEIKLIDEHKTIPHRRPRCSEAMYPLLQQKIDSYVMQGLWKKVAVNSAPPLLAIPKPKADGLKLRAVVDKRSINDNTIKDLTPFPDQNIIRRDFARAQFRSKLDMTDAYEQVRVIPEHVPRTAFSTPMGCFVSEVIQQGDCNAPATFQRLMTTIFSEGIGHWIHVYLDDLFIFSNSLEEHEKHLVRTFQILQEQELYLSTEKVFFFTEKCECLGFLIDDTGIHPDPGKIQAILDWPTPRNAKDIERFLGLVNYIMNQIPLLSIHSAAISNLTHLDEKWRWGNVEETSFFNIKNAVQHHLVLKPIDWNSAKSNPNMKVFVVCDACPIGAGAVLGQGPSWDKLVVADLWSARFQPAQTNYPTHQQELLAIVGALEKFENQLLGRQFIVVTDHRSLEYFKKQPTLSSRQVRWYEFLSKFHFDIIYVKGHLNLVADALSRKYEGQPVKATDNLVTVEERLHDKEPNDVSTQEVKNPLLINNIQVHNSDILELEKHNVLLNHIRTPRIRTRIEERDVSAENMAKYSSPSTAIINESDWQLPRSGELTPLQKIIVHGYKEDKFFAKVLANEESSRMFFTIQNDLVYHSPTGNSPVLAIPSVFLKGRNIRELIIDHFHVISGHLGYQKTLHAVRKHAWWQSMVKDIDHFCKTCHTCAMTKVSPKAPDGFAHPLAVPRAPWETISMDFIGPFPPSNNYNYLWVIMCKLTNMVHLIPTTTQVSAKQLAELFFQKIFPLHGLPNAIISDRDSKFISKFWTSLHKMVGTTLLMSSAYHPQTDGATERANRTIGTMLRSMVDTTQTDWYFKLPFVEYALNASVSKSTGYAPFELNYGFIPPSLRIVHPNIPFEGVTSFARHARLNLMQAHDLIIEARMNSSANVNKHRNATPTDYKPGKLVYLSTKNLSIPQGLARKLVPKFIGPFKIIKEYPNTSTFKLDLPPSMKIHPNFHSSLLKPFILNDDNIFPHRSNLWAYTLDLSQDQEWEVDAIISHYRSNKTKKNHNLHFIVAWSNGDITPEPLEIVNELQALDEYLELKGVNNIAQLE